jgi:hypothetical protein
MSIEKSRLVVKFGNVELEKRVSWDSRVHDPPQAALQMLESIIIVPLVPLVIADLCVGFSLSRR